MDIVGNKRSEIDGRCTRAGWCCTPAQAAAIAAISELVSRTAPEPGDAVHWLWIEGVVEERYDTAVLAGVRRLMAIGVKTDIGPPLSD